MARRKKPEDETEEEATIRREIERIANHATRSEKTSWQRKQTNLEKIVTEEINPLEDQILKLVVEKNKLMDDVEKIRLEMVYTCVHPADLLVWKDNIVECKFCGTEMVAVNNDGKET